MSRISIAEKREWILDAVNVDGVVLCICRLTARPRCTVRPSRLPNMEMAIFFGSKTGSRAFLLQCTRRTDCVPHRLDLVRPSVY